jgi:TonB family protein
MSKSKQVVNFILAVGIVLAINSSGSAQNNLTAKANSIQPQPVSTIAESDRVRDGLAGPVRRVRTEVAKLSNANGTPVEEKRVLLEVAAYDIKGSKTQNQYFPVAGSTLTGKEVYKYDEKGNISEMTLLNGDGSLLSREVYKYDYDSVGNWTRMTTSVAVVEGGKVTFEPTEVTYRSIMYYLDENMLKMAQPPSPSPTTVANLASTANRTAPVETKPQPVASGAVNKPVENQQIVTNHKSAPSLPVPAGDRSIAANSLEVKSGGASASKAPLVVLDSEAPPAPMPKPLLKPVSGGVLNGTAVSLPSPAYPETARRMRIAGVVIVQVVLDETGKVISAQSTDGPPPLREAAVQAARKARFSPTKLSGQPVKVTGVINYKFALSP